MSELKPNSTTPQNNALKDRLLPVAAKQVADTGRSSSSCSWLSLLGLLFLTFNSGMAIHRSRDDPWSVAFIVSTFLDLLLLFCCLQKFEKTPRNSPVRTRLKIAVWCLSTFLTVMFSYRVAALMPLAVAIVVWVMSLSTVGAGFYLFFIYREEEVEKNVSTGDVKPVKMVEEP
jgi:peptidoglycan/LPS O-acetylase OafA/YrhL